MSAGLDHTIPVIRLTAFFPIHVPHLCLTNNMTLLAESAFVRRRALLVTPRLF